MATKKNKIVKNTPTPKQYMVFISTHLSLRPSLSSTEGLNPFKPLLNQVGSISVAVHPSIFRHQSRIWVSISIPDYLSTNRYLKHVKRHISTSVPCATFDHLLPLMQLRQWRWITAWLLQCSHPWHICSLPSGPLPEYHCTRCGPKVSLWSLSRLFCLSYVLSESDFPFDTE